MLRSYTMVLFMLLLCLFLERTAYSQGAATGASIIGVVTDESGGKLPGATVVAVHKPSGVLYGTSTRENGQFIIQNVRVGGPYEITTSFVGFQKHIDMVTSLKLGQEFTLNVVLTESAVQMKEMTVFGDRNPILNSGKTGAATSVSREQIESIPSISRSFQDFSKLSPLFSGSQQSAAGRNNRLNNIQLDGTQYNDLFGLGNSGTPGGQANTNPISLDAIQEFQVVIAPFDVRMNGFTGGGINAVTKSGTNKYEGSVYYYNRNQDFVGKSPDALKTKLSNFSEYQTGFRAAGPIIEDKLFFFINGELTKKNTPTPNPALVGAPQSMLDSIGMIKSTLVNKYGYDPGTVDPFTAERPSQKVFIRFDYNIAQNHNLTVRDNYVSAEDNIIARTATNITFSDRDYTFKNNTNSLVLQLNSTFGNSMANEFIAGYTRIRDKRSIATAFPSLRINTGFVGQSVYAGSEEFSIRNGLDQDIYEITDNFSYYLGNHTFTFGTHNEMYKFANLFTRYFYGYYTFNYVKDFVAGTPSTYNYRYALGNDPDLAPSFKAYQFGVYAQDEYTAMPGLKITLGIRVDMPKFPDSPAKNDSVAKYYGNLGLNTSKLPDSKLLLSPRLGFNWDVNRDKSMILRGGVGIFTGRVPYVWISNQYSNTGVDFADISQPKPGFFNTDPYSQPKAGQSGLKVGASTEVDLTDPNFKMPQNLRANLGFDQQLPFNMVGSVDLLYTKDFNDLLYNDLNITAPTGTAPDGRPTYTGARMAPYFQRVMLFKNTSKGFQFNATAQVQGEPISSMPVSLAYAYGRSMDQNSVQSSQAQSQFRYNPISGNPNDPALTTSSYELRNRIVASIGYSFEIFMAAKTTISLFYNGQSGRPFSYIYSNDANGDGHDGNDLIYIPKDASEIIFVPGTNDKRTPAQIAEQFETYINNDDYLKNHRGRIAERNGANEPWIHQLDVRIAQQVPVLVGHNFEVSLDILNFPNMLKSTWGYVKQVANQTSPILSYQGVDATTHKMKASFTNKPDPYTNDNLISRWQMQLGVRYSFN